MKPKLIERYLTERCGITAGPWTATTDRQYGKTHYAVKGPDWTIALCGDKDDKWENKTGEADCNLLTASFSMLRDWICLALDFDYWHEYEYKLVFPMVKRHVTNALPGMTIEQRLEDIRRFCEEVGA